MSGDGHDGVDALIAAQQRFGQFRLIGEPNGFGDHRFPKPAPIADSPTKGTDFAVLSDGRNRSITGFPDQVPPGA
jgi:hypothetical protein